MSHFEKKSLEVQSRISQLIDFYLPSSDARLHQAMRYVCLNGGKRLRPFLVYATAEAYDVDWKRLDPLAVSVELIHCYSLVHDDLPAMDNDDLRRGKATCHKAFDEATAILVGDALQALAFEILSDISGCDVNLEHQFKIIQLLARAIGGQGMVLGQALDMAATTQQIDRTALFALHQAKTGALINACVQCSAIACGETQLEQLNSLQKFGEAIGLAFQIQDDLLDVTGKSDMLGKQTGADQQKQKSTFVSLFGIEASYQHAQACLNQAMHYLRSLNKSTQTLGEIAQYCISRGI